MRTFPILLATIGVTASALAQGLVDFRNNVAFTTTGDRLVRCSCDCAPGYDPCPGPLLVGTDYVAQLYFGTQGTPMGNLTPVTNAPARFRVATTAFPGTWGSGGIRTLEGILPGQTATLQVRVWNGTLFPTFEAAVASGGYGCSALFDYTVPPDGSPSAAYFMENFRGFVVFITYQPPPPPPPPPPPVQGKVSFMNNVSFLTPGNRLVRGPDGAPLVGTDYVAQLYHGSAAENLQPLTDVPARFRVATTTTPGIWAGGTRTLTGFGAGDMAWLQVRVWNASLFPSYESAVAAGGVAAKSCPFTYTVPSNGAAPSEFFMENFPGIPGPLDCSAGWYSWGTSGRELILSHVNVGVWRATNLNSPSWQLTTNPATLRIPMTNEAMFFKVERGSPPLP